MIQEKQRLDVARIGARGGEKKNTFNRATSHLHLLIFMMLVQLLTLIGMQAMVVVVWGGGES